MLKTLFWAQQNFGVSDPSGYGPEVVEALFRITFSLSV